MELPSIPPIPSLPSFPALPKIPTIGFELPMSAPNLATGAFSGGPKDDLAAVDIYKVKSAFGQKSTKPITSIQELSAFVDKANFDLTLDAGIATDFMSKSLGKVAIDKDTLTNRLLGTNSEFKSCYNELNDALKKGALLSTVKDKANKLMCTVNDTKSMVNSAKIGDIKSLGGFLNKYTGTKTFSGQDKGALSGLLGSVITTSSNLGITGAFKAITDTITDKGIIGRITRAILPIALKNSDTKLLKELTGGAGASLVNIFSPGFAQTFSKAFTYQGDRSKSLDSFEDVFTSIKNIDGDWDILTRSGSEGPALNLLSLMGGSKDFQNLTMTGVKYWAAEQNKPGGLVPPVPIDPMYALAAVYREVTVGRAIARDFPRVALLNLYDGKLPTRSGLPSGTRNSRNNHVMDARLVSGAFGALFGN